MRSPRRIRLRETDDSIVIPDYARMLWYVRAPTSKELLCSVEKVKNCLQSVSALFIVFKYIDRLTRFLLGLPHLLRHARYLYASRRHTMNCTRIMSLVCINLPCTGDFGKLKSNTAQEFVNVVGSQFGMATNTTSTSASTDFVSYLLYSCRI